jgi:signal transduction histidine kinase
MLASSAEYPQILVINPEPERLTQLLQAEAGCRVKAVRKLPGKVKQIRDFQPMLILIDSSYPHDGALELCSAFKLTSGFERIPVIVTGVADYGTAQRCMAAHADDFLFATAGADETLARIEAVIQRHALAERQAVEIRAAGTLRERFTTLTEHLFRNIGHELYTPFLFIKGSYTMMRKQLGETDQTDWQGDSGFQSIGRLEEIIEDMRQIALAAKPKNRNMYTFGSLLEGVLRQRSRRWSADNTIARIRYKVPPDLPILYGDFNGISQILLQFIDNALKFSSEDSPVDILIRDDGDSVWVGVRDYGIGISPEDQVRIFDMGWQADSSDKRRYEGAGIGLALAHMLAESMQLQIGVVSEPGAGSTFSISLPAFERPSTPKTYEARSPNGQWATPEV